MNKTFLIIKREYLSRTRKKTFILSTLLLPILYLGLMVGIGYMSSTGGDKQHIALLDGSGYFDKGKLARENQRDSAVIFSLTQGNADSIKTNFSKQGYDGLISIPADVNWENGLKGIPVYSNKTLGNETVRDIERKLNRVWTSIKNEKLGIDAHKIEVLETSKVSLYNENIKDKKINSGIASSIGAITALFMYIILMVYGSQVMMGVMEEKTNRIAEVVVSSVKPFQLMLGKILGICLVAITQFLLWVLFIIIIYHVTKNSFSANSVNGMITYVRDVFASVNVPLVLFCLVFYLIGGILFYASLFAAIGSSVNEDMREAQSLSFPVMMPIIFAVASMHAVIKDPSGPIAFWESIIPFTSPISMMIRIPFGVPATVPWWQLALSMGILVLSFIFSTWFAGKIYRTGILMYGKKPTWKQLIKWAFQK